MNWREWIFFAPCFLLVAVAVSHPALAQTRVGEAVVVQNQVVRVADSLSMPVNVGDGLMRDETVRTGAFRFVTGNSEKTAYKITTTVATIGVRGTVLDILSQRGKTTVVLQEGASRVCAIGGACTELTHPGDTAVITSTGGKTAARKFSAPPWTFAANCTAAPGLCTVTRYAEAAPPPPADDGGDDTGALCGR